MRWVLTASLLSAWCAAQILSAQELVPLPPFDLESPIAADSQHEVLQFPTVVSPAFSSPCHSSPIHEPPRLLDQCLEAVPHLLSHPNEHWGNCIAWVLHSPRDEVHTSLEDFPTGIHPVPERPPLLLEWGEDFLGVGPLKRGIETPTGAVWRPALWLFGEYRTALQYTDYGAEPVAEWANRLDLFGQLNLSGTERVLLGLRPLDEELRDRRQFSSVDFRDGSSIDGFNAEIQTLFFEGDFGELFPGLDPYDVLRLDYGFSVGRMPLLAQQGLLINEDRLDAITVTKNTLFTKRILNLRVTGVYGWGSVNRNSPDFGVPNTEDDNSRLVALLTESDFARSTVNADVVYVESDAAGRRSGLRLA